MVKRIFLIVVTLIPWVTVLSQDLWLQPTKFRIAPGEEISINFLIGENFEGELWDLKKNKIEKLEHHHLTKVTDLKNALKPDEKVKLVIKLIEPGTHIITFQGGESHSQLEAQKFNDFLKASGLDNILEEREKTNPLNKPASEFIYRSSKLIVQSGNKTDDNYKKRSGAPLEIIPQQNPYNLKSGDYLQCLISFEGKPVPHHWVEVWNIIGNASIEQNGFTENDGLIKFPISSKGRWMVTATKLIPSKKAGADWLSFSSSLAFEIE